MIPEPIKTEREKQLERQLADEIYAREASLRSNTKLFKQCLWLVAGLVLLGVAASGNMGAFITAAFGIGLYFAASVAVMCFLGWLMTNAFKK